MDVSQDEEKKATEAHAAQHGLLKQAKYKTSLIKKEAKRLNRVLEELKTEQQGASEKTKTIMEAVISLDSLVEEAKVQQKRSMDAPSPKRARVETAELAQLPELARAQDEDTVQSHVEVMVDSTTKM